MYTPRQSSTSLSRAQVDPTAGIHVVIQPSKSSYFAGEPFTCTITFTNTCSPHSSQSHISSASFIPRHKRAAHSVSSAPLSRPPTSPGTPKTAQHFVTTQNKDSETEERVHRRGLVGKPVTPAIAALQKARRAPTRSLSVDITPQVILQRLIDPGSPVGVWPHFERTSPTSSRVCSPLTREHANAVPPSHPHARKHSVTSDDLALSSITLTSSPTNAHPPPTPMTSTFQLSLDPITENGYIHPPTTPADLSTHSKDLIQPPPPPQPQGNPTGNPRRSTLGLGFPSSDTETLDSRVERVKGGAQVPHSALSTTFSPSTTELLLYAYAQLSGTLIIDPEAISSSEELVQLCTTLRKRTAVGGGSLDIGLSRRPRSSSSGSFFGFLSAPSTSGSTANSPGLLSSILGGSNPSSVGTSTDDEDNALPTLETQPTMLAVDLSLAAGESRSYTYVLSLPQHLPPTFKGRSMRFSYELVVGTCRATTPARSNTSSPIIASSGHSGDRERRHTRIMRVPIRIYNHVAVGYAPRPYDLMWPVARRRSPAAAGRVEEVRGVMNVAKQLKPTGSLKDVQMYAQRLVAGDSRLELEPALGEAGETGTLFGCAEAVEISTRNPKKISYDVSKDGEKVAMLTFVKSAYRLGETVLGVVELNEGHFQSKVLKLSAILEAHESLPYGDAQVRRVHAEHHASLVSDMQRVAFALDIPSDASPAFEIVHDASEVVGGLTWKVRMCLLVSIPTASSTSSAKGKEREVEMRSLVQDGAAREWGTSWRASENIAPMERLRPLPETSPLKGSWTSLFSALGGGKFHDADIEDSEDDGEWVGLGVETVECTVPLRVYAGNTAFRVAQVSFEV